MWRHFILVTVVQHQYKDFTAAYSCEIYLTPKLDNFNKTQNLFDIHKDLQVSVISRPSMLCHKTVLDKIMLSSRTDLHCLAQHN